MVQKVKPKWKFSHVENKVLKDTGCPVDSMEFQLAMTIECIKLLERARKLVAEKEQEALK